MMRVLLRMMKSPLSGCTPSFLETKILSSYLTNSLIKLKFMRRDGLVVNHGGLVVSTLDYGSSGREFKSHRGQELLTLQKGRF